VDITRRRLLKGGLIGGCAILLPVAQFARVAISSESDTTIASPPVARFAVPLAIPPTIAPTRSDTPPQFDGHPLSLVQPGTAFTHVYPGDNSAATLWYHDHAIHAWGRNVWMGLAGFFLVRDEVEFGLGLPKGAPFEVPLVFQDRLFNPDGSLFYPRRIPVCPCARARSVT
jgi:hypothetical protein